MNPLPYAEAVAMLAEEERGDGWLVYCEKENLYQLPVVEWLNALGEEILALAPEAPPGSGSRRRSDRESAQGVRSESKTHRPRRTRGSTEALDARDALIAHAPDLVFSCWLPYDSGAERQILEAKRLRWYLPVVQGGPGYAGSEALWEAPGWSVRELSEVNRWSVSRADFLSEVDSGEHVRRGMAYLFTREE